MVEKKFITMADIICAFCISLCLTDNDSIFYMITCQKRFVLVWSHRYMVKMRAMQNECKFLAQNFEEICISATLH